MHLLVVRVARLGVVVAIAAWFFGQVLFAELRSLVKVIAEVVSNALPH